MNDFDRVNQVSCYYRKTQGGKSHLDKYRTTEMKQGQELSNYMQYILQYIFPSMDGWTDRQLDRVIDGYIEMDGWMAKDGWMDGQGWMDGWVGG